MKNHSFLNFDIVIVGSGIAGLFTALKISKDKKVLLVSKTEIEKSTSVLAQGGISACKDKKTHIDDTMKAGAYINNKKAVDILVREGSGLIDDLIEYGVKFDRDKNGELSLTLEGAHSKRNVLHVKDETGKSIIRTLFENVLMRENIHLLDNTFLLDINKEKKALILINKNNLSVVSYSKLIIATGGAGQVYKNTTNPKESTGDGMAILKGIGADLVDMEFVQFHPTKFYSENNKINLLISEALRGEGAILRNKFKERFMKNYDNRLELGPRDIVARGIFSEMKKLNTDYVYLDLTHLDGDYIKRRFPMIYSKLILEGIDITKDFIRVSPASHYFMGGVRIDENGKTDIEDIYAVGEVACSGVHGSNRLASNSLLDGIVFGNRVSSSVNKSILKYNYVSKKDLEEYKDNIINKYNIDYTEELIEIEMKLKNTMNEDVGIIRNNKGLINSLNLVSILEGELKSLSNKKDNKGNLFYGNNYDFMRKYKETQNLIIISKEIIKSSIKRKENIGSYYNTSLRDGVDD